MLFLAAFFVVLAMGVALLLIRRAAPFLCATATAWLMWSLTHDATASAALSIAALLVASWLLDVFANHETTRRLTVGVEIVAAALVAGGLAFLLAGGPGTSILWIIVGSSVAAMATVARWRQIGV